MKMYNDDIDKAKSIEPLETQMKRKEETRLNSTKTPLFESYQKKQRSQDGGWLLHDNYLGTRADEPERIRTFLVTFGPLSCA